MNNQFSLLAGWFTPLFIYHKKSKIGYQCGWF